MGFFPSTLLSLTPHTHFYRRCMPSELAASTTPPPQLVKRQGEQTSDTCAHASKDPPWLHTLTGFTHSHMA